MSQSIRIRKSLFRLSITVCCLTFASMGWSSAPQESARKQIYKQSVTNATADIQRVAQQKNWQGYNSKLNVFIPSEVAQFHACTQALTSALPAQDQLNLQRLRYDIRCDDADGWEVSVTVKPDIYLPILVAKHTLERGQPLAASDVEIKKRNIAGMRDGYLTDPTDVVGLTVKKRLRDRQPVTPAHLDQPIMVGRGQRVLMIAEQNGVEARSIGEALKKGRRGEVIKVRNLDSQRIVSAVIESDGVVRMLFAPGQ
ncbi:flagellar basal body P-ring formation chaperone FlgA [Enterobacteriaceae bacterium LUAb1]